MAKLGEVCDFYAGTGFPNEYQGRATGKYPFYKVGDISKNVLEGNRELKTCANYVEEDVVQKLKGSILPPKTIVFAKIGEALKLNRRAITSCECLVDNNVMGIKAQNVRLNDEYLFYWLQNLNLSDYSESTTVPSVKKSRLQNIEINVSPLEEQEKVVSTLNKLSSLILARKKQLSKLDELVKAWFVEMFGDPIGNTKNLPVTKFVDVVKMQRGFDLPVQERKSDGMIPVYGSNGVLGYHDISKVKGGGVITGRSGTIGKVFYEKGEFWPLNTTLFSLNSHGNDVVYLKYLLELFDLSRFTEGTGVPTLNRNKFHDELIIDVPLDEQERFAAFVERVDQQKQTVQQSLEKLELMKKALMQEYFG